MGRSHRTLAKSGSERKTRGMAPDESSAAPGEPGGVPVSSAMRELADGVAFWRSKPDWPDDFHNAGYERWCQENPRGKFTPEWWVPFLKTLQGWVAIRPFSYADLTEGFVTCVPMLTEAWHSACEPLWEADISDVTWEQVEAFPRVVATIKPTKQPSPVFTSKFCHFLLPRVFPVVDNEGMGNTWATYEQYFRFVQNDWAATDRANRAELTAALTTHIEAQGSKVFFGFPMLNKLVELRIIGRRHRSMGTAGALPM